MNTITAAQVKDIEAREAIRTQWLKDNKTNYITPEQNKLLPQVTNEERSAVEFYYWQNDKPAKYFLYIKKENEAGNGIYSRGVATTWTGQELGKVIFGREYKSAFGDIRQSIDVIGNNGLKYYGTFYKSAGDYARIKARKIA